MINPLFAFANEHFILYFAPRKHIKKQLKNIKIIFGSGVLPPWTPYKGVALNSLGTLSGPRPLVEFSQEFNPKDVGKYVLVK